MKFDIVRAWKDETYRQTLSEEQLSMLPANPAGELTDAEMASVCGGGVGFGASSAASARAASVDTRFHSLALLCDISLFSINLIQIPIIPIASATTQVCAEDH
jgi:mersacidin/lichenicidin family type 2 lantibiotic